MCAKSSFVRSSFITWLLVLLLANGLSSCATIQPAYTTYAPAVGQMVVEETVQSLHSGSAWWGVNQCLKDAPATVRLVKDGIYVFGWGYEGGGWAWWGVNMEKLNTFNITAMFQNGANLTNPTSFSKLVSLLKTDGFSPLAGKDLPPELVQLINLAGSWLARLSQTTPTILVMPTGVIEEIGPEQWYDENGEPVGDQ